VDVREVVPYGVSPVRVAVVKAFIEPAAQVRLTNRTQSLAVEKLDAETLPAPYRLALKNRAAADVLAVQLDTYKDSRHVALHWLGERWLRPLFKAGDMFRLDVPSEDRACAGDDGYRPSQSDRIAITAVVFADGSYEGDPHLAALIRAKALGNRKYLPAVVQALGGFSERTDLSAAELIAQLKYQASLMDELAESYMLDELQRGLPALGQDAAAALGNFLRHGQHEVKTNLLADAEWLEAATASKGEQLKSTHAWLKQTRDKYEHWLAAAQSVAAQ